MHDWRFCLGTANCLYTNDGKEGNITLRHHPYLGTALSTYNHDVSAMDDGRLIFQGATPDRYGYCAVYACSECQATPPPEGNRDELTVFLVAGVKSVTVRKEVRGVGGGILNDVNDKFQFEAVYTDNNKHIVTNRFALANGQEFSFMVSTGGVVTVTETERGAYLYATSVRDSGSGSRAFTEGNSIGATNVWEDHVFEFRNTMMSVAMPERLWITDHLDAGDGVTHLAFEPIFTQGTVDLRSWIKAASARKVVSVVTATNEADLVDAPKTHVLMRDNDGAQDVDKRWVWITADVSDVTNTPCFRLWKIVLEDQDHSYYPYKDDILFASVPTGSVRQVVLGPSTTGYVLTNANEVSELKFRRASRFKEVLLVGGGGAGGGTVGGGGGEVRLYEYGTIADATGTNDTLWVEVGKGGSPAIDEGGVYYKGTNSVNNAPGNNGRDTTFEWGEVRLTARGGGGGGSYNSTFPGKASPKGLGRDGANGGGSTRYANSSGGMPLAEVPDGHAGGKGYKNANNDDDCAAGGGGGMKEAGANAVKGMSGNGGEGVEISIAGINGVFGSGGGGGGGAKMDNDLGYRGGRGGDGKVIFVLQDASVVDATCKAEDVTAASATLEATVVGIGKDKDGQPLVESPVPVWVRCRRDGGVWSEPISVGAAEIGETVSFGLDSLYCSADYDFEFLFGSSDPSAAGLVAAGSFKTTDPGFPVGYQDDNFIVSANAGSDFLSQDGDACTLSFTNGVTDAHVIVKKPSTFVRGLVVGGGGAGGGICGGGGGAVKRLNETVALAAGTEFVLSVGAGGRALNNTYKTQNESGGDSSVDFAGRTLTALGGGAGGMPTGDNSTGAKYWNGGAGGNGGGAAGSVSQSGGKVGTGGAGSEGYASGDACQRADKWPSVAGGGGGAAEPGENANTRRPVGKNGSADAGGHAGNGGEGVADDITGRVVVYGSGGGGGMDQYGSADEKNDYTTGRALGGTGAGDGGLYYGYLDPADTTTPRLECNGRAGQDGTGGGGAGYKKGDAVPTGFSFGGDGGDGAVVFQLRLAERTLPIEAMTETVTLTPFGARVSGTVLALGADVGPVDVWFSLTNGEYRLVKSGVTAGQSVTADFGGLVTNTVYTYSVLFSNENASVTHDGQFKTWRSNPGDYAYEDENFAVNGTLGTDFTLTMLADGQLALNVLTTSKELQIRPKNGDLSLARALVVGGGGCGGSLVGAGGGGGEVVRVDEQISDFFIEPIRVTVGAGGTENTGSNYQAENNNGGDSTLLLGTRTWTAVGGGAGATRWRPTDVNYVDGRSGGSGGGGMGDPADSASNGRGKAGLSTATAGFGYPGGNGANRKSNGATDNVPNVGGGGGGAAEPGISGYSGIYNVEDAQAGHGGEGLADDIAGSLAVYGSGGGGGDNRVKGGKGGTNGGDGGPNVGDDAKPGVDGFGGGGGGRGYKAKTASSGRGGRGAVILRFRTKGQPINAVARQVGRTLDTAATVEGKVLALGEGVDGVMVSFSRDGESWEPLQTNVGAGQSVQKTLDGLERSTIYTFYFKFETAGGETVVVPGQFKTARAAIQVTMAEFMASNSDTLLTANGTKGIDWVELRNEGYDAVDVAGWTLSNKADGSKAKTIAGKAVVPGRGQLIVWANKDDSVFVADEPYVKMGIDKEAGTLILADSAGTVRTAIDYPDQIKDISYGPDTSGKLGYFDPSTPGVANGGNALTLPTPAVEIDVLHGYKTEPFTVGISCAGDDKAEIHYTTNGAKPTSTSPLYTDRITIDRTTCLRAAVVDENSVLQNDASATYIFLDDVLQQDTSTPAGFPSSGSVNGHAMAYGFVNLPAEGTEDRARLLRGFTNSIATISLVADPKDLFDSQTGIYVNPSTSHGGQEWERKILVEQIDPTDDANGFSIPAGLRLRGAGSLNSGNPKHSFRLFFRGRYGAGSLKFPLFGDEGADEFDKVDLRTSQNYSWASSGIGGETFVHETFARDTQRDMGVYYTRSRYYNLYINGQYWGLYQTQERGDEDFAETYAGGKADDYDVIKTTSDGYRTEANAGSFDAWRQLWTLAVQQGVTETYAGNYMRMLGCNPDGTRNPDYPVLLNRDNLIAHTLNTHYMVDGDSPVSAWGGHPNNMYALRDRKDGKAKEDGFFFLRHDAEHSMGTYKCQSYRYDYCRYDQDPTDRGNFSSFEGFNPDVLNIRLCGNADYKMALADAFYRHCLKPGGALTDEKALARFRSRMAEIDDVIVCEACRWGRSDQKTRETWLKNCDECLYFITNRMPYMVTQYRNRGWYPSIDAPTVTIADGKATFTAANPVYYTLDGSDPRTNGILAEGDVTLPVSGTTVVRARCKSAAGEWSAMDEETFVGRDPEMDAAIRSNSP